MFKILFIVVLGMFFKLLRKGFKVFILRLIEGDIFWVIVVLYCWFIVEGLILLLFVFVFLDIDVGFVVKLFVVFFEKLLFFLILICFFFKEDFFFLVLIIGLKLLFIFYFFNFFSISWCWFNLFNMLINILCVLMF